MCDLDINILLFFYFTINPFSFRNSRYNGKIFIARIPRICFGRETNGDEIFQLGKFLGKMIEASFICHTNPGYLRNGTKDTLAAIYAKMEANQLEKRKVTFTES